MVAAKLVFTRLGAVALTTPVRILVDERARGVQTDALRGSRHNTNRAIKFAHWDCQPRLVRSSGYV